MKEISLSCTSSIRIGFSAIEPISNLLKVEKKEESLSLVERPSKFKSRSSQWRSMSSRPDIWYPLVSRTSALRLERTSSITSNVPSWIGVIEIRAIWSFKRSCLWDKNKFQASRVITWELIVLFWMRSFTVRISETGLKSRDLWIRSVETEKVMQFYCVENLYKTSQERKFWLIVSVNGCEYDYPINGIILVIPGSGCLWLAEVLLEHWGRFFCFVATTHRFDGVICTSSKENNFHFFSINEMLIRWQMALQIFQS